jgi:hypothetical protein
VKKYDYETDLIRQTIKFLSVITVNPSVVIKFAQINAGLVLLQVRQDAGMYAQLL